MRGLRVLARISCIRAATHPERGTWPTGRVGVDGTGLAHFPRAHVFAQRAAVSGIRTCMRMMRSRRTPCSKATRVASYSLRMRPS